MAVNDSLYRVSLLEQIANTLVVYSMRSFLLIAFSLFVFGSSDAQTAACNDGAISYSRHHSGTCSSHGGVQSWIYGGPTSENMGCGTYVNSDGLTTARPCAMPVRG